VAEVFCRTEHRGMLQLLQYKTVVGMHGVQSPGDMLSTTSL
jgi:hypothetical protein